MTLFLCDQGGRLSGADWPVPTDPAERDHPGDPSPVPCSRLGCPRCGAEVRHRDGVQRADGVEITPPVLWERIADGGAHPALEGHRPSRLYACRCMSWREGLSRSLDDPDRDLLDEAPPPWRCAGHPSPSSPVQVDGFYLLVGQEAAVVSRIRDALWTPETVSARLREQPSLWLCRLIARTDGLPEGAALRSTVLAGLAVGGEEGAGVAAEVFAWFPELGVSPAALDVLEGWTPDQLLLARAAPNQIPRYGSRRSLAEDLGAALLRGAGDSQDRHRVLALLHRAALAPGVVLPGAVRDALAAWDGPALARALPRIETARPGSWREILLALADAGPELPVLGGIALLRGRPDLLPDLRGWVEGEAAGAPWALPLRAAWNRPEGGLDAPTLLHALVSVGDDLDEAASLASRLAGLEPEFLFDAAVELSGRSDILRSAVWRGGRAGAPAWFEAHGDALAEALELPMTALPR